MHVIVPPRHGDWKYCVGTNCLGNISPKRAGASAEISARILMGGRAPVSFYVAAVRAWPAPTFSWHAAPHQRCNKSIFILTPARPTSSPPPDPFPSPLLYSLMASFLLPSFLHRWGSQLWMVAKGGLSRGNSHIDLSLSSPAFLYEDGTAWVFF